MPKVSVIVPVYNKEKYISRCIESILNQSMTDWELILVDDCSTDNSLDIMDGYVSRDDRIRVRRQEDNHGPMIARRLGDEMAKGDYITYCDADDTLPKMALQTMYDEAVRSGADIVSGNYEYCRIDGTRMRSAFSLEYGSDRESILKSLLKKQIVHNLCSKLFRRSLLIGHNYKVIDHMTNAEDAYMFYQILLNIKKMVQLPDIVYSYIQTPDSSTQRRYSERALDNICLFHALKIQYIVLFPNLKTEIIASVSQVLINLKYKKYDKNGGLKSILIKYDLQQYCSNISIFRYHSFKMAIKLLMKKIFIKVFL